MHHRKSVLSPDGTLEKAEGFFFFARRAKTLLKRTWRVLLRFLFPSATKMTKPFKKHSDCRSISDWLAAASGRAAKAEELGALAGRINGLLQGLSSRETKIALEMVAGPHGLRCHHRSHHSNRLFAVVPQKKKPKQDSARRVPGKPVNAEAAGIQRQIKALNKRIVAETKKLGDPKETKLPADHALIIKRNELFRWKSDALARSQVRTPTRAAEGEDKTSSPGSPHPRDWPDRLMTQKTFRLLSWPVVSCITLRWSSLLTYH